MDGLGSVAEKLARGSLHLFIGNLVAEIINAVGVVVVGNLLTSEEMGRYSLSFVLPGVFLMFTGLGLDQALIRFLTRLGVKGDWDGVRRLARTGLLFQAGMASILSVVMFLASDFLASSVLRRPELVVSVRIGSVLILSQAVYTMAASVFYGIERMDLMAVTMVVHSLVKASASPLLIIMGYGVLGPFIGHLLGVVTVTLLSILLIFNYLRGREGSTDGGAVEDTSLRAMLRFGSPLYLSSFIGNLGMRYQGLLLAWFATDAAIGNLDIATKFKSLVTLFTVPVTSVIFPAFSKFDYREQSEELRGFFRASVRYATFVVVPATTLLILVSREAVTILFSSGYPEAPLYLSLGLLPFFAVGLGSLSLYAFLNSQGDTSTTFRLVVLNVVLSMISCTVFTSYTGVTGLQIGVFASTLIGNAVNLYVVNRRYSVNVDLRHTLTVFTFSGLSGLLSVGLLGLIASQNHVVNLIACTAVFLAACLLLAPISGAVVQGDIDNFRRFLGGEPILRPFVSPFVDLLERIVRYRGGS